MQGTRLVRVQRVLLDKFPGHSFRIAEPSTLCGSLIGIALLILAAQPACATNRTVTNLSDSGPGSLRDTIAASGDGDTINFSVTGAIALTTAELFIAQNISVNGPGANVLTVTRSSGSFFRIFRIGSGTVSISGLTITGGRLNVSNNSNGGGIYNEGTLTLNNCALSGNSITAAAVDSGGGIYNSAILTMTNCTVSGNSVGVVNAPINYGYGGGIYNSGTLDMTNCTLSGNSASGSTSTNNAQIAAGGGIYNANTLTLTNLR